MRQLRRAVLVLAVLGAGSSAVAAQQTPAGVAVLRQVHDRYVNTRFRTVSFLQKTTFPDGRGAWWYEAESIPGKARVDVAPFENRNTSIFRGDSAYVWRNGEHARRPGPLAATMWTLMDMYAVSPEETAAALQRRNFDLTKVHERMHEGRPVIVVGALDGDTTSAQFWLDRERLYTVKMIVPTQAGRRVTDVSKHTFQNGGWIEGQIVVYLTGNMTRHEEYHDIRTNVTLPPAFFESDEYRPTLDSESPARPRLSAPTMKFALTCMPAMRRTPGGIRRI